MRTKLLDNETLLRDARANMERGLNVLGGHLYLTSARLVFESHGFMQAQIEDAVFLNRVHTVSTAAARLLRFIPLANNAMRVSLIDGDERRYVVPKRDEWILAVRGLTMAGPRVAKL